MALIEVHAVGDAKGIPVHELAELGKAVPKGWLFGNCGHHPSCFLFKPADHSTNGQVGFGFPQTMGGER